jgi:hypothetical protein
MKSNDNVKSYFQSFPNSKEVHETSDGLIFHLKGDAMNHSKSLGDAAVTTYQKDAVAVEPDGNKADETAQADIEETPKETPAPKAKKGK